MSRPVGTMADGGEKTPRIKSVVRVGRKRNRPGNFANYGKPSFPAAKAYPFEWGRMNGRTV